MILYGMSYLTMAFRINLEMDYEHQISEDETKKSMHNFFKHFSGIATYIKRQKRIVNNEGRVKNLIGKIFYLPNGVLKTEDYPKNKQWEVRKLVAGAERQATNYPIQSGASAIITVAMRDIRNYFMKEGSWFRYIFMVNQVHDKFCRV